MRYAKIVCTLGPASNTEEKITALVQAGMNVARVNFSHGTHEDHAATIQRLRAVAKRLDKPISILQDLQGPKIRTGTLAGGQPVELKDGEQCTVTTRDVPGTAREVSTTYAGLPHDVRPGAQLLLDDGKMELKVEKVSGQDVVTRVVRGGLLREHKGINMPGVVVGVASLTDKDRADLAFGIAQQVDYVAISFVQKPEDVANVKRAIVDIDPRAARLPVIAKLEKPSALDNLDAIVDIADGVMVARGDLGVELSPQRVPTAQKCIIEAATRKWKFVITATQMLESMMTSPIPTRAEASDVANAIYDGTDAVMLSGETAMGQYPVEAVSMMGSIVEEAEQHIAEWGRHQHKTEEPTEDDSRALALATRELAHDRNVSAIAVFTRSGHNANTIAKARPHVPILAFTPDPQTYTRLPLVWGVIPYLIPEVDSVEAMIAHVEAAMLLNSPVRPGQQVILMAGLPTVQLAPVNFILLHTVGRR